MKSTNSIDRYIIFSGHNYYPSGGWADYQGSAPDFFSMKDKVMELRRIEMKNHEWLQVIDLTSGDEVWTMRDALVEENRREGERQRKEDTLRVTWPSDRQNPCRECGGDPGYFGNPCTCTCDEGWK
jgi:hypothetical protein